MNTNRLLGEGKSYYHAVTRCVGREYFFRGAKDKEVIRKIMRRLESLLGVKVITFCIMSNHIHLLLEVPDQEELPPLDEEELLKLLPSLYDSDYVLTVRQEFDRARELSTPELREERIAQILGKFEKRRGDLSTFMKEFKHRVTRYINKKHNRVGTLWESRFKSVLVEGNEGVLLTMAAYIDLNPVRAGMVERPEDYRWCGYAEAAAGNRLSRKRLGAMMSESWSEDDYRSDWRRTHNRYRLFLYSEGREMVANPEKRQPGRKGFSEEEVAEVEERKGAMPVPAMLRHKVRYFCDGAVLGTADFVNEVFTRERNRFGPNRETGARRMRGANWGELRVLRNLRENVVP